MYVWEEPRPNGTFLLFLPKLFKEKLVFTHQMDVGDGAPQTIFLFETSTETEHVEFTTT